MVRNKEAQWGRKEKDTYRTESEKESCLKQHRQITEERNKYTLVWDRRCGTHFQKGTVLVTYLSTSNLMGF